MVNSKTAEILAAILVTIIIAAAVGWTAAQLLTYL